LYQLKEKKMHKPTVKEAFKYGWMSVLEPSTRKKANLFAAGIWVGTLMVVVPALVNSNKK
jgi:hypothetical protein